MRSMILRLLLIALLLTPPASVNSAPDTSTSHAHACSLAPTQTCGQYRPRVPPPSAPPPPPPSPQPPPLPSSAPSTPMLRIIAKGRKRKEPEERGGGGTKKRRCKKQKLPAKAGKDLREASGPAAGQCVPWKASAAPAPLHTRRKSPTAPPVPPQKKKKKENLQAIAPPPCHAHTPIYKRTRTWRLKPMLGGGSVMVGRSRSGLLNVCEARSARTHTHTQTRTHVRDAEHRPSGFPESGCGV
eukprot:1794467-Rhodomonas_salina.3